MKSSCNILNLLLVFEDTGFATGVDPGANKVSALTLEIFAVPCLATTPPLPWLCPLSHHPSQIWDVPKHIPYHLFRIYTGRRDHFCLINKTAVGPKL